jgi:hypothetical protein
MTKLGYPLLPVIVRAEPDLGTGMSQSKKPSLVTTTLGVFIALCLISPFCVIGFGTLGGGGNGTKYSNRRSEAPLQQSLPVTPVNEFPARAIDDSRKDSTASSPSHQGEEPADSFAHSAAVTEWNGIAAQAKSELPHGKTVDGAPPSGKVHRRAEWGLAVRRTEQIPKGKTAHHRGKANSTVNRTFHGQKRRAALSKGESREDRGDQADLIIFG